MMYYLGKINPANRLLRHLDYKTRRIQDNIGEMIPILQNLLKKKENCFSRITEFRSRTKVLAIQLQSAIIIKP